VAGRDGAGGQSNGRAIPAPAPSPLNDRIPSGTLSGALPWLCTTGNQITIADGQPVLLRGVSLLGLDSAAPDAAEGFAAGAGLSEAVIAQMLDWGSTVLRVAINGRERGAPGTT
jgi:hypothetical protein